MMETFFGPLLRNRWPAGREDLHWHVLPPADLAEQLVANYAPLTSRPGLAAVQARWLHCTILHSLPVGHLDADLTKILAGVEAGCAEFAPWQMVVDRPVPGLVAVEAAATPGVEARKLCRLISDVTAQVTGTPLVPHPADDYYPHLSLAYASGPVPDRPLRAWLSDHFFPPVAFEVRDIALVAQSHDGREITWRRLATIPLGGPPLSGRG